MTTPPPQPGCLQLEGPVLVIPDLHDQPVRLEIASRRLQAARRRHGEVRAALLGDAIDRGSAAVQTLAFIERERPRGLAWVSGNHEAMACLGCLRRSAEAEQLRRIWLANGGVPWLQAMGGSRQAVAMLGSLQAGIALAAEVQTRRGRVLLAHAQLPSKAGWDLIERAGTLAGLEATEGHLESPSASWLWGDPRIGIQAEPRGHALAVHGHHPLDRPALGMAHTIEPQGEQQTLMMDLEDHRKLATLLILPSGSCQLSWGGLSQARSLDFEL